MDAPRYDWTELLTKYFKKDISPDELQELERQKAASRLKQQQWEWLTKQAWIQKMIDDSEDTAGWDKMVGAFLQKKADPFYKRKVVRSLAAACLLVLIIAGYWFSKSQTTTYPFLQLSDGKKINLHSISDGRLPLTSSEQFFKKGDSLIVKNALGRDGVENGNYILSNPTRENYNLQLPDGSHIQLNAFSSVKFPGAFGKEIRSVETSGETFFDVAKNGGNPFIVTTCKGTKIEVLGTLFNVSAYDDGPEKITLLEGAIKLVNNKGNRLLKPGQQAVVDSQQNVTVDTLNKPLQTIAWTDDVFDFNNKDIQSILRELATYYHATVHFEGNFSRDASSGRFPRKKPLLEILRTYEKPYRIEFKRDNDQWYVKSDN